MPALPYTVYCHAQRHNKAGGPTYPVTFDLIKHKAPFKGQLVLLSDGLHEIHRIDGILPATVPWDLKDNRWVVYLPNLVLVLKPHPVAKLSFDGF